MDNTTQNKTEVISLKAYFERIIEEHGNAINIASSERDETALSTRQALEESMKAGDMRLQDHITHQVEQVHQALVSFVELMKERDARNNDRSIAIERQYQEFKESVTDRFATVNEFRHSLDDLGKLMATKNELLLLSEKILPLVERNREELNHLRGNIIGKESFELANKELTSWRTSIDKWRNEMAGKGEGISGTTKAVMSAIIAAGIILGMVATGISLSNSAEIQRRTEKVYSPQKIEMVSPAQR